MRRRRWQRTVLGLRAAAVRAAAPRGAGIGERTLLGSTRLRLAAWGTGITVVVILVVSIATLATLYRSLLDSNTAVLERRADGLTQLMAVVGDLPGPGVGVPLPVGPAFGGDQTGTYALVITPDGRPIIPTSDVTGLPAIDGIEAARATPGEDDLREVTVNGAGTRVLTRAVPVADGRVFVIQVADDLTDERATFDALLGSLVRAGLFGILLAGIGGFLYASRALAPIQASLRRQREFAADASHELRTPLTVMRGTIEDLERHPARTVGEVHDRMREMRDEVDHLIALIESLLLLARTDSGTLPMERVHVDLGDAVAAAVGSLGGLADERAVRIEFDAQPTQVTGDPVRLRQIASILVDNAIRHTPPGGTVRVRVGAEGDDAQIVVDDEGPGIADADMDRLFDRFYRAPGAPPGGSGLGLSIASGVARSHGGTIGVERLPGHGSRFVVRLPLTEER